MSEVSSGIEKIRYERLKLVCRKALEQSIKKSLSIEQIKTCYPTIASTEEGVKSLEIARSQVIRWWHSHSLKEFDLIFSERDIENKLNELDEIIQTARLRKQQNIETPVEIDKMTPSEIINSTLLTTKKSSLEILSMIYNQLCLDNRELFTQLKELAVKSDSIKANINESLTLLKTEIETLNNENSKLRLDDLIETYMESED